MDDFEHNLLPNRTPRWRIAAAVLLAWFTVLPVAGQRPGGTYWGTPDAGKQAESILASIESRNLSPAVTETEATRAIALIAGPGGLPDWDVTEAGVSRDLGYLGGTDEVVLAMRETLGRLYIVRARARIQQDQFASGLSDSRWAMVLSPGLVWGHLLAAQAKEGLGKFSEALDHYDFVLRFDSRNINALLGHAAVKRRLKDYDSAIADLNLVIATDPSSYRAYLARGRVREDQGNDLTAMRDYRTAVRLMPEFAPARTILAAAQARAGNLERARATLLRHRDFSDPGQVQMIGMLWAVGEFEAARERTEQISADARRSTGYLPLLTWLIDTESGDRDDTDARLRAALDGSDPGIRRIRPAARMFLGELPPEELADALVASNTEAGVTPEQRRAEARFFRAAHATATGQPESAREHLQAFFELRRRNLLVYEPALGLQARLAD